MACFKILKVHTQTTSYHTTKMILPQINDESLTICGSLTWNEGVLVKSSCPTTGFVLCFQNKQKQSQTQQQHTLSIDEWTNKQSQFIDHT